MAGVYLELTGFPLLLSKEDKGERVGIGSHPLTLKHQPDSALFLDLSPSLG